MKSKQLANVLIKMLGLSVCLYAIQNCIAGILVAVTRQETIGSNLVAAVLHIVAYPIGAAVQFAIGIAIIIKSQKIAGWMFKGDQD
jgi:cytochrome c biogenesis protein CcdA